MPSPVSGFSQRVTVPQHGETLGPLMGGARMGIRVKKLVLYCPDGTDPGIAANTDTVYVGENKSSAFPLQPGAWTEMLDVNPFDVGCRSDTASQLLFFHFGGGEVDDRKR
jgi:hypothetical protein